LSDAGRLTEEVFGPVLHVVRYRADRFDQVLQSIERSGYGLTLGIHSRIDDTVEADRVPPSATSTSTAT
jgi:RHH-type proline utilization regulon transcriptional repressor/proline dehydrogenase/delta 1-pyrroline-5-carboxylate dehydrogenase